MRHWRGLKWAGVLAVCFTELAVAQAMNQASNSIQAGELVMEPPTLIALGFEWQVAGDADRDAVVTLRYRKPNEQTWHAALPLLRLNGEVNTGEYGPAPFVTGNLFVGSIMDLEPNTDYVVQLLMTDPDGISGEATRTVNARTRAEPKPAADGRVFHVYPYGWRGELTQPAFYGLPAAYYDGPNVAADHFNVYPHRVKAGDIILVHAGVYKDERYIYGSSASRPAPLPPGGERQLYCCGATFYGTYFLTAKGTADKPIVIKAAGDGEVVFDGNGAATLFNVMAGDYHYFEGLTFRNAETAIQAGHKQIAGAVGLTVKHSRFEDVGEGIHTDHEGSKDFYIADNVFIGRDDPNYLVGWRFEPNFGQNQKLRKNPAITADMTLNRSPYAVKVYGSGHVIAYNRIRNFHDGIDHHTYGMPVGYPDMQRDHLPVANDYYNNDISNMHDDCIETDGGVYNFRILRNRCVNAAGAAFSFQPFFAGPVYVIRNVAYHTPGNFASMKFAGVSGIVAYNNTLVGAIRTTFGATANNHFRNNLVLSEFADEPALTMNTSTRYSSFDYNGYMAGSAAEAAFNWSAPAADKLADYSGKLVKQSFVTLKEFTTATGQEQHGVMIDYRVFADLKPADTEAVWTVYDPEKLSFALRRRGKAVDAGTVLPGITDGFKGKAPDLGAYELGVPMPHYGPR